MIFIIDSNFTLWNNLQIACRTNCNLFSKQVFVIRAQIAYIQPHIITVEPLYSGHHWDHSKCPD